MPYNLAPLSNGCVYHNTKVKVYPDGSMNITYSKKSIFREKGVEVRPKDDVIEEVVLKEREEHSEKRDRSEEWLRVNRDRVRDICIINDFTHFLTITINPEKIDSFDVEAVKRKLRNWLNNMQNRKGLKYILIPEYHKSGRIHCHALVNDVFQLVDSGKRTWSYDGAVKVIYNVVDWRYGWSTCIPLDKNKLRIANYVTKYLSKGSDKIFGKYFWSSKNLQREPEVILTDYDYSEIDKPEFKPVYGCDTVGFKYENTMQLLDEKGECPDLDFSSALATEGMFEDV